MSILVEFQISKDVYETFRMAFCDVYDVLSLLFPCLPTWIISRKTEALIKTCKCVQEKLKSAGIKPDEIRECALKIGIPILENASLEEEEELSDIWASLLANAMNPTFNEELRTAYIDIAKSLSPLDVRILEQMRHTYEFKYPKSNEERINIANLLYTSIEEIEIS